MSEAFQIGIDPARDGGGKTVVNLLLGDDVHIIREPFASALLAQIARKDARIKRLEAALKFYAGPENWEDHQSDSYAVFLSREIIEDNGKRARTALAGDAP